MANRPARKATSPLDTQGARFLQVVRPAFQPRNRFRKSRGYPPAKKSKMFPSLEELPL